MCLTTAVKQLVLTVKLSSPCRNTASLFTNTPHKCIVHHCPSLCNKNQRPYLYLTQKRNPHIFVAHTHNATRERHNNRITSRAIDLTALHRPVSRETMYHIVRDNVTNIRYNVSTHPREIRYIRANERSQASSLTSALPQHPIAGGRLGSQKTKRYTGGQQ